MGVAKQRGMRIVTVFMLVGTSGCACGIDPVVDTINSSSEENVAGDANSNTTVDDVEVEEANLDADTNVDADADVDADVDTNVEDSGNVSIDVNVGAGDGDANDDGDDVDGGASARGDGFVLEAHYQGPVDERVDLVPGFDDALAGSVDSVEWLVRGPVLDTPTIFDDEDGFAWGAPQLDDVDDALDEYTLAARFGEEARAPFAWTTESSWCSNGTCDGRAVSAACTATIVLRVWLLDGTARELTIDHESARPACWW
jgi:hypothetical protein